MTRNRLENIDAAGDVSGGSMTKNINYYNIDPRTIRQLEGLCEALKSEIDSDCVSTNISQDLLDYGYGSVVEENLLNTKLSNAQLDYMLDRAYVNKERFRRHIERYIHYSSAQNIFSFLMSAIIHYFDKEITSAINDDLTGADLHKLVAERVVEPIVNAMPASEISADHSRVWGIIYFLTGNCFLYWVKQ